MILDELVLHDFGVYGGRQTMTLTPPDADRPIILFGGLNGGGKTTLLDAIQLVLFGPFAKCSNRNGQAYPDYLVRSIHQHGGSREAAIELAFRHSMDGTESSYRLHRSWRLTASDCKERFEVCRDGRLDRTMTENWANQVEDFIPANIAHLFLFDGEKVEGYASSESAAQLIGTAIQNLLGLDIVDQLEGDLMTFERRKRLEGKDDEGRQAVAAAEREVEDLRKNLDRLKQERAALRTSALAKAESRLRQVEETYRKIGGELYDQRSEIEARRAHAEAALTAGAAELREMASGCLPLLLCRDLLSAAAERAAAEAEGRHEREVLSTIEDRDEQLVTALRAHKADPGLLETVRAFFEADRESRRERSVQPIHLALSQETHRDLQALLKSDLEETSLKAEAGLGAQQQLQAEFEHAQLEAASIPEPDSLAAILEERERLKADMKSLEDKLARLETEIEQLTREFERKQQSLARLLAADAEAQIRRDDLARLLHHSPKVRRTLGRFRQTVIARHLRRIEQLVLESYQQLLRKTSLVTGLSIDPGNFTLTLFSRDGAPLSPERLSAGERQLLAIALLWGLAKASGRPLPTAIDTPLGRLDGDHRAHLVERYFPFASHQVLLLSTDEEIAGEYYRKLEPWIGRNYQLDFDEASGATRIRPGYFAQREAA